MPMSFPSCRCRFGYDHALQPCVRSHHRRPVRNPSTGPDEPPSMTLERHLRSVPKSGITAGPSRDTPFRSLQRDWPR
jgi:hypothetical protein